MELIENNSNFSTLRKHLKLSQDEFAEKLGTSQDMISKIETGKTSISQKISIKLLNEFNVNLNWLFSGKGSMFLASEGEKISLTAADSVVSIVNGSGNTVEIKKGEVVDLGEIKEIIECLKYAPKPFLDNLKTKLKEFKKMSEV